MCTNIQFIDAQRGVEGMEEGATHVPPSKDFKKMDHNNAIKQKIEDPLPKFFTTSSTPSKKLCFSSKDCVVIVGLA